MTLVAVAPKIWIAEGDAVNFYGFPYPTRSVVVALGDESLWVWSPIRLSSELKADIDRLGTPTHLVSPNKIHHLFLSEWKEAYPEAQLWGPASTIKKRGDLSFGSPLEDKAPPEWGGEIEQVWFNGSPALDEVVFFHRPSRTAILADLSENFSEAYLEQHWSRWQQWFARAWKITEKGGGMAPLEWRMTFFKRAATRAARDRVLDWDPANVVMAHGTWKESGGREFLERSFAWVG